MTKNLIITYEFELKSYEISSLFICNTVIVIIDKL